MPLEATTSSGAAWHGGQDTTGTLGNELENVGDCRLHSGLSLDSSHARRVFLHELIEQAE
jgi:hypothetical protein